MARDGSTPSKGVAGDVVNMLVRTGCRQSDNASRTLQLSEGRLLLSGELL